MYAEASAHPEVNKYQDTEATYDNEGTEDMHTYLSFITGVTEDHDALVVGAIDEGNTHKTPYYDTIINLDVTNIDKNDKINGGQYTRQWMNLDLERLNYFPEHLLFYVKSILRSLKIFHLVSREIFKNSIRRKFICAGGEDLP